MRVNGIILALAAIADTSTAQYDYGEGYEYEQDNLYQDYAMKQDRVGGG